MVNAVAWQGQRIILPRVTDVVQECEFLMEHRLGNILLVGVEVKDAFHNVPVNKAEAGYQTVAFAGKNYILQ
eukprot:3266378-Amphidinium_carterae.2